MDGGGSNHPVEKQTSVRMDQIGALARRRVRMRLADIFLAPAKQDNESVYPPAAPRMRVVSMAVLL